MGAVSRHRRAFTLIELLVVVAIIAVLIAMLVPSLSKARQLAKSTKCLANLKAIGTALNIYMTQNDEVTPERGYTYLHRSQIPNFRFLYAGTDVRGYFQAIWADQLVVDGGMSVADPQGNGRNDVWVSAGTGLFRCPTWADDTKVSVIGRSNTQLGDVNLYFASIGYGLLYTIRSQKEYVGNTDERRFAPPGMAGQPDPGHLFPEKHGNNPIYALDVANRSQIIIRRHNINPNSIIAYDGYAVDGSPFNQSNSAVAGGDQRWGLHKRHFGAPNYLFGDGHAESNKTYHLFREQAPLTPAYLQLWKHYNNSGGETQPW